MELAQVSQAEQAQIETGSSPIHRAMGVNGLAQQNFELRIIYALDKILNALQICISLKNKIK